MTVPSPATEIKNRSSIERHSLDSGWNVVCRTESDGDEVWLNKSGCDRRTWKAYTLSATINFGTGVVTLHDSTGEGWGMAFENEVPNSVIRAAIRAVEEHARTGY